MYSRESKKAEEPESFLDCLIQFYKVVVEGGRVGLWRALTLDSLSHHRVVHLIFGKLSIASGVHVTHTVYETDLVRVPGHVAPVRLKIFKENAVKFQVLAHFKQDLVGANAFIAWQTLIPLGLSEVHRAHVDAHIQNGTLLSGAVLQFNSSELCILVTWHQVDATLRQFLE